MSASADVGFGCEVLLHLRSEGHSRGCARTGSGGTCLRIAGDLGTEADPLPAPAAVEPSPPPAWACVSFADQSPRSVLDTSLNSATERWDGLSDRYLLALTGPSLTPNRALWSGAGSGEALGWAGRKLLCTLQYARRQAAKPEPTLYQCMGVSQVSKWSRSDYALS